MINILPSVVTVSDLIKVAAKTPAITAPRRIALIRKTSAHEYRRIIAPGLLF